MADWWDSFLRSVGLGPMEVGGLKATDPLARTMTQGAVGAGVIGPAYADIVPERAEQASRATEAASAAEAQAQSDTLRANATKNYLEAKGRAAQSRGSLESLIQQFHDIAAGRTKTEAEKAFEEQYQGAQNSAMANMAAMEGLDQASLMRLRAQQAGAIQARREQDQRVLREQITDQAKQQAAGLTGVLNQGDQDTANLEALYNQGMSSVDWEEKTGQAAQAWQGAANAYGLATTGAKNALGDYGRDSAFWQGLSGNIAELGATTAAYGNKAGWFTGGPGATPTPTGRGPAGSLQGSLTASPYRENPLSYASSPSPMGDYSPARRRGRYG